VVAKKLERHFIGVEANREYCCWAIKRLGLIKEAPSIQGYVDGVFWERNSLFEQSKTNNRNANQSDMFSWCHHFSTKVITSRSRYQ